MRGWWAGVLVAGVCGAGQYAAGQRLCGRVVRVVTGHSRLRGMAAKRGGETLSPAGPARHRKRPCAPSPNTDFIPLSHTPPRTPSPAGCLDLGDFIFIDTTPTPVPDAPAPPPPRHRAGTKRGSEEVEVVEVRLPQAGDTDIAVLYEGPGRGGAQTTQRRGCHTEARRGINTQAPAAPALAPPDEEVEVVEQQEVEVVEEAGVPRGTTEVEVIDVDTVDVQQQQQQQQDDDDEEDRREDEDEVNDGDSDGDSSSVSGESGVVDVSGDGFVSLTPRRVCSLNNTSIDLSDEVLRRRRHLEALRPWDTTGLGKQVERRGVQGAGVPLTVLSYNVLAQSLLRDNPGLYRGCEEDQLSWEYRWALLQHEVDSLRPDVLLLQEVEAGHYHSHYLPWLVSRGYQGLYKKRTGTKADGCAIFYHSDGWSLAEHTSVEYYQPAAPAVLDRDNVGIIARLLPRDAGDGAGVCVATTHLLYNPRRHDVKLAQAALLLAEMDRMCYVGQVAGQPQYCPVVLAGDLNAEPHTALLSFLQEGRLNYQGLGRRTLTRHGGQGPELGLELLPPALGITGACQHAALAQGRWLEGQRGPILAPAQKRQLEEALIRLHHSDRPAPAPAPVTPALLDPLQCPGWLSHAFLLKSVYRQRRQGRSGGPEVTTFQERWVCVDYLMYSRARHPAGGVSEGRLKLLARLTLPTPREAAMFSPMPSDVCPSDHFPLAARFLLHP